MDSRVSLKPRAQTGRLGFEAQSMDGQVSLEARMVRRDHRHGRRHKDVPSVEYVMDDIIFDWQDAVWQEGTRLEEVGG